MRRAGAPLARRPRLGAWAPGVALACAFGLACRVDSTPPALRLWTNDLAFQVTANPVPPPARQDIVYKVVVRYKNTGQAIEGGEGRIYATSRDGINTWDALTPVQPAGTYTGKLNFITSGDWAMGMQFRRDSTRPIEQMDW